MFKVCAAAILQAVSHVSPDANESHIAEQTARVSAPNRALLAVQLGRARDKHGRHRVVLVAGRQRQQWRRCNSK